MKIELPIEIQEKIVDVLAEDIFDSDFQTRRLAYQSLRSCALVSRGWEHRSRNRLLRRIIIRSVERLHAIEALLKDRLEEKHEAAVGVEIHQRVQDVAPAYLLNLLKLQRARVTSWSLTAGNSMARGWSKKLQESTCTCFRQFSSVQHLSIAEVCLPNLMDLIRLLLAWPALRTLSLGNVRVNEPDMRGKDQRGLKGMLKRLSRTLKLVEIHVSALSVVLSHSSRPSLTSYAGQIFDFSDARIVISIIPWISSSIEKLSCVDIGPEGLIPLNDAVCNASSLQLQHRSKYFHGRLHGPLLICVS